jgi:two-component system sensor histidine kinase UhpB
VQECLNGEADTYEVEHRMLHKDGSVRWFLSRGSVVKRADGTPGSLIGTDVDVTERKAAERERGDLTAQLQHLAGQLIVAQETERARIARDLHDDVSQQLAGLAIALSSLKRRVGTLPADDNLRNDVSSLQRRTIAVSENVRHLSHDLHSSVLQHAGLVAGLTAHCDDIRRYENLEVSFSAIGDFESADADAALCLYRVAQEALRNIVKHADARRADVRIRRVADDAELTVSDDGKGFDVAEARKGRKGLGLISINERARLAGGTVAIATELNGGTRVQIRIPVVPSLVLSQTPRP